MFDLRSTLELPGVYRLFVKLIGESYRAVYLRDHVKPVSGERVLDIGCGPGDVLGYLPSVDYLGLDYNPRYVKAARARYGSRAEFRCEAVANLLVSQPASFDLVMANGLLHHLTEDEVRHLFAVAGRLLKPTGRVVTFDGCFVPGQSLITRILLRLDRGRYVRSRDGYLALAAPYFRRVQVSIRHDLYRIPYTHIIMVCSQAAVPQGSCDDRADIL
jgi:SAM-dependent methyltransferase